MKQDTPTPTWALINSLSDPPEPWYAMMRRAGEVLAQVRREQPEQDRSTTFKAAQQRYAHEIKPQHPHAPAGVDWLEVAGWAIADSVAPPM